MKKEVLVLFVTVILCAVVIVSVVIATSTASNKGSVPENNRLSGLQDTVNQLNEVLKGLEESYESSRDTINKQQEVIDAAINGNKLPVKQLKEVQAIYEAQLDLVKSENLEKWLVSAKPLYDKACLDLRSAKTDAEMNKIIDQFEKDIKALEIGGSSQGSTGTGAGTGTGTGNGNQGSSSTTTTTTTTTRPQGGNDQDPPEDNEPDVEVSEEVASYIQMLENTCSAYKGIVNQTKLDNALNQAKQRLYSATNTMQMEQILSDFMNYLDTLIP